MAWELKTDEESGVLTVTTSDTLRATDVTEAMHAIWESPFYLKHLLVLWDLRSTTLDLNSEESRSIAEIERTKRPVLDPSRVAILANKDLNFGLSRMLEAYMPEHDLKLMVFREESEALRWLTG